MQPKMPWKSNKYYTFSMCVCSLLSSMPTACTMFYCHLSHLWFYSIFQYYLTNSKIFQKNFIRTQNVCSDFLNNFLSETSLILRRTVQDIINARKSSSKVPLFLADFNETRILTHFQKILRYKFNENPSSGSQMGRQTCQS